MWALVESGSVSKIYTRPTQLTIGDIKYPRNIFELWSESELKAIGIYTVVVDNTNLKDSNYYRNTDQSFNFASDTVTASYGTATAKDIADTLYTAQDETDGLGTEGEVKTEGLKTKCKRGINANAGGILAPTDWMVIRATEGGTAVPSSITTQRAAVRTKANEMCTAIDNVADVDALATLYAYTNTGTEENPVYTRPLGELPTVG
jgi:hypothetical protein|tara:strand:+ start:61 stop:675 length:615 start_codon:yes stop_codon:yes gene_type:complete